MVEAVGGCETGVVGVAGAVERLATLGGTCCSASRFGSETRKAAGVVVSGTLPYTTASVLKQSNNQSYASPCETNTDCEIHGQQHTDSAVLSSLAKLLRARLSAAMISHAYRIHRQS